MVLPFISFAHFSGFKNDKYTTILVKNLETLVCVSLPQCWFGYYSGLSASKYAWLKIGEQKVWELWEVNLKNCLENSRETVSVSTICDEYWNLLSTFATRGVFPKCSSRQLRRTGYKWTYYVFWVHIKVSTPILSDWGVTPGNSWCGCAARFSKSWPFSDQKNIIFHTHFKTWGPFLERTGNFSSPNANFEFKTR